MSVAAVPAPRKLRTAEQIRALFFDGTPINAAWVRANCPRVELSRNRVLYDVDEVARWIDAKKAAPYKEQHRATQ